MNKYPITYIANLDVKWSYRPLKKKHSTEHVSKHIKITPPGPYNEEEEIISDSVILLPAQDMGHSAACPS